MGGIFSVVREGTMPLVVLTRRRDCFKGVSWHTSTVYELCRDRATRYPSLRSLTSNTNETQSAAV